jgi:hypothetical protein
MPLPNETEIQAELMSRVKGRVVLIAAANLVVGLFLGALLF